MSSYYVIRKHPTGGFTYCKGQNQLNKYGGLEEDLPVSQYSLKFTTTEEIYDLLPEDAAVIEHDEL
jgi:hypothetical protein